MNLYPGVPQDIVQHVLGLVSMLNYLDKPRVQRDVLTLLKDVRSLTPNVGPLMYSNGQQETLIHLNGTVPILFKGVQYNIPVCVWLPLQYPNRPPIPYVTPTKDMRIKDKHRHVDAAGIVYLPYLNQWNPIRSQLTELSNIMSAVFSEDPPCYKASTNMPPQPQPALVQPPPAWQPTSSSALAAAGAKIMASEPNSYPPPAYGAIGQQQQISPNSAALQAFGAAQPASSASISSSSSSSSSLSSPSSVFPSAAPASSASSAAASHHHVLSSSSSPVAAAGAAAAAAAAVASSASASVVDSRAAMKDELVRKVTQKLRTALIAQQRKAAAELESLLEQQNQLQSRQATMEKLKVEIAGEIGKVSSGIDELKKKSESMREWAEKHENRPVVPVDKSVIAKDTWSKQLMESVVEDVAIDDALFYLQRAFADGRLDAQNFFKLVRTLARKQFFARALAIKVRAKLAEQKQQHMDENKQTPGNDFSNASNSSPSSSSSSSLLPAPSSNLGLLPVSSTQTRSNSGSGTSAFGIYVPPSAATGRGAVSFNPPSYGSHSYTPPSFPLTYK